jgi:hypothetical protein
MLAAALAAAFFLQAQAPAQPAGGDDTQNGIDVQKFVSIERVREGLEKPPSKLTLRERKPDFVVEISERQRFEKLIAPFLQFDSGSVKKPLFFVPQPQVGTTPSLASIDLLSLASAIGRQISGARHERATDAAHSEVLRAIAEYCAAQPNGGTGLQICMNPTSIR